LNWKHDASGQLVTPPPPPGGGWGGGGGGGGGGWSRGLVFGLVVWFLTLSFHFREQGLVRLCLFHSLLYIDTQLSCVFERKKMPNNCKYLVIRYILLP
jgi:hypothetical protein